MNLYVKNNTFWFELENLARLFFPDEKITVYFLNAKAPCFIKDEEQSYIYMVLPVNFVN